MLMLFYLVTMVVAFTSRFMGANTNYYLRLGMGILWIVIWAVKSRGILDIKKILKILLYPWIWIFVLTLLLWIINRPVYFEFSYFTRMCSNVLYCFVATLNAYIGIELFGKTAVKISFFALLCSIGLNLINVWLTFGTANILTYITNVLTATYSSGSILEQVSMNMEVQGPTMALGTYFLYYLLCDRETKKNKKILYILLSLCGLYLGFKRVVLLGVLIVIGILWILEFKRVRMSNVIRYTFACFILISFGYIIIVKNDVISMIAEFFAVDMMGRDIIYRRVAELYDISLLYLGKGFGYASKYMFDTTGFAVHSDILRMYIELGCVPFVIWIWYYISYIPQKVNVILGKEAGKVCLIITVFTFSTYLVENTLGLYPLQYSLSLFSLLMMGENPDNEEVMAQ